MPKSQLRTHLVSRRIRGRFKVAGDKAPYNQRLMAFRPVRDYAIGPLIVAAVLLGWLLALALLLYVATQK
jgi:hypothetical protein